MAKQNATENAVVDFSNPEALAAELEAAETTKPTGTKEKKPPKPRKIKVSYVADKDYLAGETIEFEYEIPKSMGVRGQLVGIALTEMTDEQLKIEYRNANSVHYKTKKAGGDATKAAARLDAVKAEMTKRGIQPTSRGTVTVTAASIADLIKTGAISVDDIQKYLDDAAAAN